MFTYSASTGIAYSDTEDFDQWCADINLGRQAWLDVHFKHMLPATVYAAAHKNAKGAQFAHTYLAQNGYQVVQDDKHLITTLLHHGKVVSTFKVALQPPDTGHCRLCHQPLEPTCESDLCANCTLEGALADNIRQRGGKVGYKGLV